MNEQWCFGKINSFHSTVRSESCAKNHQNNNSRQSSRRSSINTERSSEEDLDMVNQTPEQFFKIAMSILNYKYDGNPQDLESFIADVEYLGTLALCKTHIVVWAMFPHM